MSTCKFTKKSFTYLSSCILSSFFKNASRLLPPKRLSNCASKIYFTKYKQKVVLLVIYLFNYNSSKLISLMLNVAFDFVLVWFSSVNWNTLQHKGYKNILLFLSCVFWYVVLFDKKLIALHHDDIRLFWNLYLTHTFSNNLDDDAMITFYLMFELHNFLWSKYLGKTCYMTKPFLHSKIQKTQDIKKG